MIVSACGGGGGDSAPSTTSTTTNSSSTNNDGTASDPIASISKSTAPFARVDPAFFAASRFLEHATFGPTPADVTALKGASFATWIDAQLALPVPVLDTSSIRDSTFDNETQYSFLPGKLYELALTAPDQLRQRASWALIQLLVVSQTRVSGFAEAEYYNTLRQRAFGKYKDLLRAVTIHATMGFYQDNALNRRAGAYPGATPNENFSRELMQLFSIGLVELNQDGTPGSMPTAGGFPPTHSPRSKTSHVP